LRVWERMNEINWHIIDLVLIPLTEIWVTRARGEGKGEGEGAGGYLEVRLWLLFWLCWG
jgi:hypothetical protein